MNMMSYNILRIFQLFKKKDSKYWELEYCDDESAKICVYKEILYLVTSESKKIFMYSLCGEYISEIKLDIDKLDSFAIDESGIYVVECHKKYNNIIKFSLTDHSQLFNIKVDCVMDDFFTHITEIILSKKYIFYSYDGNKICIISKNGKNIKYVDMPDEISVSNIWCDDDTLFVMGCNLYSYNINNKKIEKILDKHNGNTIISTKNFLVITEYNKIQIFNKKTKEKLDYIEFPKHICAITSYNNNLYVMTIAGKIYIYTEFK